MVRFQGKAKSDDGPPPNDYGAASPVRKPLVVDGATETAKRHDRRVQRRDQLSRWQSENPLSWMSPPSAK